MKISDPLSCRSGSLDAGVPVDLDGSIAWAISGLTDQDMPSEEIATLLGTDDPGLIHRLLELHRERLQEHLADQRHTLARLERLLAARVDRLHGSSARDRSELAGR